MLETASPELQLVAAVTGTHTQLGGERIESLVQSVTDWDAVFDIADAHAAGPHLYRHLVMADESSLPEAVRAQLIEDHGDEAIDRLYLASELVRLVDAFAELDVPVIPFKGPILAQLAFGDVTARRYGDLDFIVRQADLPEVVETLESMAYSLVHEPSMSVEEISRGGTLVLPPSEFQFYRESDGVNVEVRWVFGNKYRPVDYGFEALWDRCEPVSLLGGPVRTLSPEDYLVVLTKHGAKHAWARLGWVADIAQLVHSADLDWDAIETRARSVGVARDLQLGLSLLAELTDVELPPRLLSTARSDRRLQWLIARIDHRFVTQPTIRCHEIPIREELLFEVVLSPGPLAAASVLWSIAFRPIERDYEWRPLPRSFHWLYYLSRPVRVPVEFATRIGGRAKSR